LLFFTEGFIAFFLYFFSLVGAATGAVSGAVTGAAGEHGAPQLWQNCTPSAKGVPHFSQIIKLPLSFIVFLCCY
jgi:hypothetical protein